jgi:hypothetical protein
LGIKITGQGSGALWYSPAAEASIRRSCRFDKIVKAIGWQ